MAFWIAAAGVTAAVLVLLALAILRGRAAPAPGPAEDLRVYRDQLREIDRDLARGTIPPEDAERLRIEVARRILEADRRAAALPAQAGAEAAGAAPRAARIAGLALVALAAVAAFLVYRTTGAPGYPDLPLSARIAAAEAARSQRPSQAEAEAQLAAELGPRPFAVPADAEMQRLMEELRRVLAERPDDLVGHELLARNEAALGDFAAAQRAQAVVIRLKGAAATAEDHAVHADLMIRAAGGYVSPEAEAALAEALRRDPANGPARYYTGLMFLQTGRPDLAFRLWAPLLAESPPDAPWVEPLRAQIEEVAWLAGVQNYTPPAPPRGPSAADVEAAAAMDPAAREQMIRGMVAGLAERLEAEGGPAADWARLITAYGVLGETEAARRTLDQARGIFAGRAEDLAAIEAAARGAGLAP